MMVEETFHLHAQSRELLKTRIWLQNLYGLCANIGCLQLVLLVTYDGAGGGKVEVLAKLKILLCVRERELCF